MEKVNVMFWAKWRKVRDKFFTVALFLLILKWNFVVYITSQSHITSQFRNNTKSPLSLYLTKYHTIKMYPVLNEVAGCDDIRERRGMAPRILNLSTRWRWLVMFTPWLFYPQGRTGGWVVPRASLNMVEKRNNPSPSPPLEGIKPQLSTP